MVVNGNRIAKLTGPDGRLLGWLAASPDMLRWSKRIPWSFRHKRWSETVVRGRIVFADSRPPIEFYERPDEADEHEKGVFTHLGVRYRLRWLSGEDEQTIYSSKFADWE